MTLHKTVEVTRKFLIGVAIGIVAIVVFMLIFRLGVIIKNIIAPPEVEPANSLYGVLPVIPFPQDQTQAVFTYELNTVTGALPQFPDRINIYPISKPQPSLLNLNKAKEKIKKIEFINDTGLVLPETLLTEERYAWFENKGLKRRIDFNIVTSDFVLESDFLLSPEIINTKPPPDKDAAIVKVKDFLNLLEISTDDIDQSKTGSKLFSVKNGVLTPETNISRAKIIRIDLQQKNLEYELNTGIPDLAGGFKKTKMNLPIVYSHPPLTTMSFWLASIDQPVVKADFVHKIPETNNKEITATYYIKTANEAFDELKNGKAYIASYSNSQAKVVINTVYLAYYLNEATDDYLMPVIVFEGDNDFVAYVSAIKTEWVK